VPLAELVIANKELKYQHDEKEKRASELVIAKIKSFSINMTEGDKRASELVIAK